MAKLHEFWKEWRTLIIFLIVMVLFRSAVADWNQVPTGSMKPTILEGDRVVVNKLAYSLKVPFTTYHLQSWAEPTHGEIVTFYSPRDDRLLIKRVIGTPGDVIAMRNNQLFINEKPASYGRLDEEILEQLDLYQRHSHDFFMEQFGDERYPVMLRPSAMNSNNTFEPIRVPDGYYLMLGDNRDSSADFRAIGFVSRDRITGRAHTIAFSYGDYFIPRMDRFIRPLEFE